MYYHQRPTPLWYEERKWTLAPYERGENKTGKLARSPAPAAAAGAGADDDNFVFGIGGFDRGSGVGMQMQMQQGRRRSGPTIVEEDLRLMDTAWVWRLVEEEGL